MKFDFVEEWYNRGNKEEKNYIYRFFCYFLALNWLYSYQTDGKEYMKIRSYIELLEKETNIFSNFNALSSKLIDVQDERSGRVNPYIKKKQIPLFVPS
jgi:hypothetical protein